MASDAVDRSILNLVEAIYEAGSEPARWQYFADACTQVVPGASATILANPHWQDSPVPFSAGWHPDFLASYVAYYHKVNTYQALLGAFPPGYVSQASEHVLPEWREQQQFFQEWLKPAGNYTHGASVWVDSPTLSNMRLCLDIPEQYAHLEALAGRVLRRILPHVRRALEINGRLDKAQFQAGLSAGLLQTIAEAALIVDARANIIVQNDRAEALVRSTPVVRTRTDRLSFADEKVEAAFKRALATCTGTFEAVPPLSFAVPAGVQIPLRVLVLPLRIARPLAIAGASPRLALVLISDGRAAAHPTEAILRSVYGLSAAESRIVLAIVGGDSPADAADRFSISRATARNQLAAAMRKLGVRRQSDVVAAVTALLPRIETGG